MLGEKVCLQIKALNIFKVARSFTFKFYNVIRPNKKINYFLELYNTFAYSVSVQLLFEKPLSNWCYFSRGL